MIPLIKPNAINVADQCREMGLQVGDVIQGKECHGDCGWSEARLTLLFIGKQCAVFATSRRNSMHTEWVEYPEQANWELNSRHWYLVPTTLNDQEPKIENQDSTPLEKKKTRGYRPELCYVRKDDIYAARMALTDGVAYTQELLANHDRDLGRKTRSNKVAAEHMEKAIAAMQCALIGLRASPD